MIGAFYWDPNPALFTLPWLGWPILWYSVLFALGFALGFVSFASILTRFFLLKAQAKSIKRIQVNP